MEPGGFEHEPVASRIDVARVVPAWIDAAEMDEIIAREQTAIKNTTASAWAATRRDAINALLATAEWSGKTIDDLFAFAQRDVTTWERGVRSLRESLPTSYDDIRAAAGEQLGRWLPDWEAPATTVSFGLYRRADFRIDDDTIYVDLGRLGQAVDPQGTLRQGLSHELVHRWFHEVLPGSTDPHTYLREKVVNEGLAMFVAEQSLADHHRQTPEQYAETSARAIATIDQLLQKPDLKFQDIRPEFLNMGAGYYAGERIVRDAHEELGDDGFRETLRDRANISAAILRHSRLSKSGLR